MLTLSAGAALLLMSTQARSAEATASISAPVAVASQPQATTSQPQAAASQPQAQATDSRPEAAAATPAPAVATAPAADPRYSASNLKRAFNYMDDNHDGLISREEASGFRGVAKNFDKADTDHDNTLSREEFERAMNYVKSKPR